MGNKQSGVEASTAQQDEHSQKGQETTEMEGEKRIWADHMYKVTQDETVIICHETDFMSNVCR